MERLYTMKEAIPVLDVAGISTERDRFWSVTNVSSSLIGS